MLTRAAQICRDLVAIILTGRTWRALINKKLRPLGQTASFMETMVAIAFSRDAPTQMQIAKILGINRSTLSRTLTILQHNGLVVRGSDGADMRRNRLRLTRDGLEILAEMLAPISPLRSSLLQDLPPKELEEARQFMSLLLADRELPKAVH